jgi:vesicle-fusing ATPase
MTLRLKVTKSFSAEMAETNRLFVNNLIVFPQLGFSSNTVKIGTYFYTIDKSPDVLPGFVAMRSEHRKQHSVSLSTDSVDITFCKNDSIGKACEITFLLDSVKICQFDSKDFVLRVQTLLKDQPLNVGQKFSLEVESIVLNIVVISLQVDESQIQTCGRVQIDTKIKLMVAKNTIKIIGQDEITSPIFKTSVNLFDLGIGGLDKEFQTIFRKAFASRAIPKSIVEEMGIKQENFSDDK